jgi:hypothetical protein
MVLIGVNIMTYKEYDNIFLETGQMGCKINIDLMSKNIKWFYGQHETGSNRNFTEIATGEVVEITNFVTDPIYYVYSIGVGDYIYGVETNSAGDLYVFEYSISTGVKTSIFAWAYDDVFRLDFFFLSYLEPHKVLNAVSYTEFPYDVVNLIDFTNQTSSIELECSNLLFIDCLYADIIDGHLKGFAFGFSGVTGGWGVYHKDFTIGGGWSFSEFYPSSFDLGFQYEDWTLCNNRYMCVGNYIGAHSPDGNPPCRLEIACFDMENSIWQISNTVNAYFFDDPDAWQVCWDESFFYGSPYSNLLTSDMTTGNLLFANHGYGWGSYNEPPPYNHGITWGLYFQFFGEYNPETNTLTCIQTNGWNAWDTSVMGSRSIYTASTPEHAYFVVEYQDSLLDSSMTNIGISYHTYDSFPLQDEGNIQFVETDFSIIEARGLNGAVLMAWDLGITYDWLGIMLVGNGIIVEGDIDGVIYQLLLK